MKFCCRLVMVLVEIPAKSDWVSAPYFGEAMGDARPWLMARWKAYSWLPISTPLQFRNYKSKCVQLGCYRGLTSLHLNFTWTGSFPSIAFGTNKIETLGHWASRWWRLHPCAFPRFDTIPDRQTDKRTDGFAVECIQSHYSASQS